MDVLFWAFLGLFPQRESLMPKRSVDAPVTYTISFSPACKHILYECVGERAGWQWCV